jgi:hypothetical protein
MTISGWWPGVEIWALVRPPIKMYQRRQVILFYQVVAGFDAVSWEDLEGVTAGFDLVAQQHFQKSAIFIRVTVKYQLRHLNPCQSLHL